MTLAERISRLMPGPVAVVFLLWLLISIVLHQPHLLDGDGDPARHIRHGLWILEHGSLIHADPFSFTRPGEPFVGFEYGSQVIFALAHQAAGLAGVAGLSLVLIALTPALVVSFLLRRGVDPLLALFGAMVSGVVAQVHFVARPHLFTFIFTLVLLSWLERDRRPPWWAFGLLFVIWVNLHGGVLFGLVLVGLYLLAAGLKAFEGEDEGAARVDAKGLGFILAVGAAALFLTPYGAGIPAHLMDFFGEPFLRENTAEFRSPDFHWALMKPFLAVLLGMMAVFAVRKNAPPLRWLLVIVVTIGFALLAQRNIALFGLIGLPLFILYLDAAWRRLPDWRKLRAGFERGALASRSGGWILLGTAAIAGVALNGGTALGMQLLRDRFDGEIFPTTIVQDARAEGVEGRLFHEFTWGGWLLYAWPEQKVFIDGGTDFYGSDLFRTFLEIRGMMPGWREYLDQYQIHHALLRVETPLAHELARAPGWGLRACDATGVFLSRHVPKTGHEADSLMACLRAKRERDDPNRTQ